MFLIASWKGINCTAVLALEKELFRYVQAAAQMNSQMGCSTKAVFKCWTCVIVHVRPI